LFHGGFGVSGSLKIENIGKNRRRIIPETLSGCLERRNVRAAAALLYKIKTNAPKPIPVFIPIAAKLPKRL